LKAQVIKILLEMEDGGAMCRKRSDSSALSLSSDFQRLSDVLRLRECEIYDDRLEPCEPASDCHSGLYKSLLGIIGCIEKQR